MLVLGFFLLGCWCLKREDIESSLKNRKIQKIRKIGNKKAVMVSWLLILVGIIMESYINSKIFFSTILSSIFKTSILLVITKLFVNVLIFNSLIHRMNN